MLELHAHRRHPPTAAHLVLLEQGHVLQQSHHLAWPVAVGTGNHAPQCLQRPVLHGKNKVETKPLVEARIDVRDKLVPFPWLK